MSAEQFEALLVEVRNGASNTLLSFVVESVSGGAQHHESTEDVRAVYHAAEVALAMLNLGRYVPKKEAVEDMRYILAWLDSDDEE